jgi:hypothetical protein
MTPLKKILPLLVLAALYLGAPATGRALPVAIGFPPPGVTVVGSGASGSAAGRTFNYTVSQNPPAGYSDLYWTVLVGRCRALLLVAPRRLWSSVDFKAVQGMFGAGPQTGNSRRPSGLTSMQPGSSLMRLAAPPQRREGVWGLLEIQMNRYLLSLGTSQQTSASRLSMVAHGWALMTYSTRSIPFVRTA